MQSPEFPHNREATEFTGDISQKVNDAVEALDQGHFHDSEATATELIRRIEMGKNQKVSNEQRLRIRDVVISTLTTTPLGEKVDLEALKGKIERTLTT